ncbi:cytochrome p450 domain-containing protein [Ditylenchus destructor]|uniref:Cytochrome p450 domain-containing protein n=1 Tax=Ditylenchus destructor TaxID=166010 RepID=A0AAD4QWA8_9BILA|nr:cytochrome p450 domain-containing protein [Ditylenchus destructor]
MGKSEAEAKILIESDYLIDSLKKELKSGIREHSMIKWIDLAVGSIINQLLFGYRFSGGNEEEFETLKNVMDEIMMTFAYPAFITVIFWPALRKFPIFSEIQRMCNLLPQNLFHRTMRDVELNGYILPKTTNVVPQISCVLFDEKIFPEPHRFKPERFLDKNGQLLKVEELIPFSIGKRICLGENLARMELFLLIANIFHMFKVRPVDPLNPPTAEKIPGFTVRATPYKVRLELRHSPNVISMYTNRIDYYVNHHGFKNAAWTYSQVHIPTKEIQRDTLKKLAETYAFPGVNLFSPKLLENWQHVFDYDRRFFGGMKRDKYVKTFLEHPESHGKIAFDKAKGDVIGIGCIGETTTGNLIIGPLYADSPVRIGERLLKVMEYSAKKPIPAGATQMEAEAKDPGMKYYVNQLTTLVNGDFKTKTNELKTHVDKLKKHLEREVEASQQNASSTCNMQ